MLGQSAAPRPDLNRKIRPVAACRECNPFQGSLRPEKMLPEFLPRFSPESYCAG